MCLEVQIWLSLDKPNCIKRIHQWRLQNK